MVCVVWYVCVYMWLCFLIAHPSWCTQIEKGDLQGAGPSSLILKVEGPGCALMESSWSKLVLSLWHRVPPQKQGESDSRQCHHSWVGTHSKWSWKVQSHRSFRFRTWSHGDFSVQSGRTRESSQEVVFSVLSTGLAEASCHLAQVISALCFPFPVLTLFLWCAFFPPPTQSQGKALLARCQGTKAIS